VPKPACIVIGLLLVLAGCATPPPRAGKPRPPDWSATPLPEPAPPAPAVAPQPVPPPAVVQPQPVPVPTAAPESTWISLTRWAGERGLARPRCLSVAPVATYALGTAHGVFTAHIGSREAEWDGVDVRLGFAPQLIDGQVWMPSLDVRKTIEPLLQGFAGVTHRPRVIVLDPGHGGVSAGAHSSQNGGWEKDFTLDLAVRLGRLLAAQNWQVFLTRTNDTDVPLTNRVEFASQCHADLFVSLHFNSSGGDARDQAGLETYCLTPVGMPSNLTRGFEDDAKQAFPNNAFDAQNVQLALHLHRAVLRATGQTDRGVRRARFLTVLRGQQCPAVLIEGGYLSNAREAQRIADWQFRQKLAEAMAQALK
jgi:N-acetylmuramoyl-L-alanine amidase